MRLERDFPDYRFEGREDACRILDNHTDEIADALVFWHKTDRSQSFNLNDVDGHSWAFEGHRYSGMTFDLWTGCAVLESIPAEFHESDSTQWIEHRRLPGESRIQVGPPKGSGRSPGDHRLHGPQHLRTFRRCCAGRCWKPWPSGRRKRHAWAVRV